MRHLSRPAPSFHIFLGIDPCNTCWKLGWLQLTKSQVGRGGISKSFVSNAEVYTTKYYSAIKKNEIMPLTATWMQLEILILREVSQKEKDKYHISLVCGI